MTHRRTLLALAASAVAALALPTAAGAATVTVTGDTGQPLPLSAQDTQIRNMSPEVTPAFDTTEKRYAISIVGPDGVTAASTGYDCIGVGFAGPERVKFLGNGTYTVTIRTSTDSTDSTCAKAGAPQVLKFTINAYTSVAAPAPTLLTRKPGTTDHLPHVFGVGVNPGADAIEVRYARGVAPGPDGGLPGTPDRALVDLATGTAGVTFYDPGTYTFVSRAVDYGTNAATAWSAPVTVRVLAPFDFVSEPYFSDSRGPKYAIKGTVREDTARGKVAVSIAKGRKGGRFHKLKTVRIGSGARFTLRFTQRRRGVYRLKYVFKGSATVAGGSVTQGIRIKRVRF